MCDHLSDLRKLISLLLPIACRLARRSKQHATIRSKSSTLIIDLTKDDEEPQETAPEAALVPRLIASPGNRFPAGLNTSAAPGPPANAAQTPVNGVEQAAAPAKHVPAPLGNHMHQSEEIGTAGLSSSKDRPKPPFASLPSASGPPDPTPAAIAHGNNGDGCANGVDGSELTPIDQQRLAEHQEVVEAAKATLTVAYRAEGPPLGVEFDDVPTSITAGPKKTASGHRQKAAEGNPGCTVGSGDQRPKSAPQTPPAAALSLETLKRLRQDEEARAELPSMQAQQQVGETEAEASSQQEQKQVEAGTRSPKELKPTTPSDQPVKPSQPASTGVERDGAHQVAAPAQVVRAEPPLSAPRPTAVPSSQEAAAPSPAPRPAYKIPLTSLAPGSIGVHAAPRPLSAPTAAGHMAHPRAALPGFTRPPSVAQRVSFMAALRGPSPGGTKIRLGKCREFAASHTLAGPAKARKLQADSTPRGAPTAQQAQQAPSQHDQEAEQAKHAQLGQDVAAGQHARELRAIKELLSKAEASEKKAQEALKDKVHELSSLKEGIQAAAAERVRRQQATEQELTATKQKLAAAEGKVKDYGEALLKVQWLVMALNVTGQALAAAEAKAKEDADQLKHLQEELASLKESMQAAAAERERNQQAASKRLQATKQELTVTKQALEEAQAKAKEDAEKLQQVQQGLVTKLTATKQALASAETKAKDDGKKLLKAQQELTETRKSITTARDGYQQQLQQNLALQAKIAAEQQTSALLRANLSAAELKATELEKRSTQVNADLQKKKTEALAAQSAHDKVVKELRRDLDGSQARVTSLVTQLDQKKARVQTLENARERMTERLITRKKDNLAQANQLRDAQTMLQIERERAEAAAAAHAAAITRSERLEIELKEAERYVCAKEIEDLEALRQMEEELKRVKEDRAKERARADKAEAEVARLRQRDLRQSGGARLGGGDARSRSILTSGSGGMRSPFDGRRPEGREGRDGSRSQVPSRSRSRSREGRDGQKPSAH